MDTTDIERFEANREWFNSFFGGCKKIFDEVDRQLKSAGLQGCSYYYMKSNAVPSIPPCYVMGCDDKVESRQFYAVFDRTILGGAIGFKVEPSIVVVRHSDGEKGLWLDQYGLKVMSGQILDEEWDGETQVLSGLIDNRNQTRFQAFQVAFEEFSIGDDLTQTVESEIVERLRRLPPL